MENTLYKSNRIPFTQIANQVLVSTELSLKAKGLYAYMLSKPDGWNFTLRSMAKQLKEGVDGISSGMKELKDFGVVTYEKHSNGSGTYHIDVNPNLEKPNLENPNMGKSQRISNKDLNNNKDSYKKNNKKDFTFSLLKATQYQNLSEEYKQNLLAYAVTKAGNRAKELLDSMVDYHSANGKGFKDWAAAFRTWKRNDEKFNTPKQTFKAKTPEVGSIAWRLQNQQSSNVEAIEVEVA